MSQTPTRKISGMARLGMRFQVFMLTRNWMGPMGDFVLVIRVKGRKTGREYSTPISYIRDGASYIALTPGGASNWFKNVRHHPDVTLNVRGKSFPARGTIIDDAAEVERVFEIYKSLSAFKRIFGVEATAPQEELIRARDRFHYMRLTPQ